MEQCKSCLPVAPIHFSAIGEKNTESLNFSYVRPLQRLGRV